MSLAAIVICDLGIRAGDFTAHYTNDGVLPIRHSFLGLFQDSEWRWSLFWIHSHAIWQGAMFVLAAVSAFGMLLGYRTRLFVVLTWASIVSLHTRNLLVLNHSDHLIRNILFWCMFLPLGATFSLDARRQPANEGRNRRVFSAATVALMLQFCIMYWSTAIQKTDPVWTETGWALYDALNLDTLTTPFGRWLAGFPEFTRWATTLTLWLELIGPLLLFVPVFTDRLRLLVIAAFVGLHLGILLCFNVGFFSWISMACWAMFLPSSFWNALTPRAGTSSSHAAATASSNLVVGHASPLANVVVSALFVYILLFNAWFIESASTAPEQRRFAWFDGVAKRPAHLLGLEQQWNMFAPHPILDDGWFLAVATQRDGKQIDLLTGGQPVSWAKPRAVPIAVRGHRWTSYLAHLPREEYAGLRNHFVDYLTGAWNAQHQGERGVDDVQLFFMHERTVPYPETPQPRRMPLPLLDLSGGSDGPGARS